jgi:hypothetical protein
LTSQPGDLLKEKLNQKLLEILLLALLLSACRTIQPAPSNPAPTPARFRSQAAHLEVDLPAGWAASEQGGLLARPFEGLVAFNSWGAEGFWARQVASATNEGLSFSYSPETVLGQVPVDGAYIVLVDFSGGPPTSPEEYGPEHTSRDLEGLWEPGDCRASGPSDSTFFKWGRRLRLEVYCGSQAGEETRAAVDRLLASWRFDSLPAGDVGWATVTARQLLPPQVNPAAFPILTGSPTESLSQRRDILWMTRADVLQGGIVAVTFTLRWEVPQAGTMMDGCPPDSCHWWRYEARPDGQVLLAEEGGAALPIE